MQPTADGSNTLFSAAYGQTYHSTNGALVEAEHVFLRGAGVEARLQAGLPTRVLEVGLGAGLNFWVSARCGLRHNTRLDYVALEKHPLPPETLAQLDYGALLGGPAAALWPRFVNLPLWQMPPGEAVWEAGPHLRLSVVIGEATTSKIPPGGYHAVYLDAFSPDVNPELWTPEFMGRLFAALEPEGKLATYSARGTVRRALQAAGFEVSRQPGPPGKREMVVAVRPTAATAAK
ncbi:MAG: tRNA (5-methylaminomethyl-2-thiouridine)(34)-methyltransferase MnmD [Anaerolineae bacterium]